jgi:hypothetical protein
MRRSTHTFAMRVASISQAKPVGQVRDVTHVCVLVVKYGFVVPVTLAYLQTLNESPPSTHSPPPPQSALVRHVKPAFSQ